MSQFNKITSFKFLTIIFSSTIFSSDVLHPIFVSFCGLISTHISLFKALQEKSKLIKIENQAQPSNSFSKTKLMKKSISNNYSNSMNSLKLENITE